MILDLRLPMGLLFAALGLLLTGYGLLATRGLPGLGGINVNLWAGVGILAFGRLMLAGAWRARL